MQALTSHFEKQATLPPARLAVHSVQACIMVSYLVWIAWLMM